MSMSDEIKRLHELFQAGALTADEFAQAKAKLIADTDRIEGASASSDCAVRLNRLRRSKTDRWLGGICGGLARATGFEAWVWRLCFFLFTLYFGVGLIIYIVGCIFVPLEE